MKIVKQISEEGVILKNKLDEFQSLINKYENEYANVAQTCKHELRELTPKELKERYMAVGADCLVCGSNFEFAWRCKKSPDSVCHYFSNDGKVEMIDGTLVGVPNEHNSENEDTDSCIFCHHPEERK